MGVGSWLSRFFERQLAGALPAHRAAGGLVGGLLPALLFVANACAPAPSASLLYGAGAAGRHAGRAGDPAGDAHPEAHFSERYALKDLVSQVLTFDYLGALAVSVAFPLLLVPQLGLIRTGLLFGLLNAAVALWALWLFRARAAPRWRAHALACVLTLAALAAAFAGADRITTLAEDRFYQDRIVFSETSALPAHRRHRAAAPASGCSSTATCSSPRATSTATTRRWCIRRWPRTARRKQRAGARRRRRHGGARGAASTRRSSSVTLVELDPHMTRLFAARSRCCARSTATRCTRRKVHDRQHRRLPLAASRPATTLRRDRGRLPRPDQLLDRQALHRRASTRCSTSAWRPAATRWCRPPRR